VDYSNTLLSCSDEELLGCFRRGQREAFGVLVRRYEGELFGYLRRYLGDSNLADDVFQNTFLALYTKIGKYEPGRPVRPWLYTIATHQAIDALRRQGRRPTVSLDQERAEESGDMPQLMAVLESPTTSPLEQLQEEERRQVIRASVDQLSEPLKQVIILAYYQSLKYKEVAEILGIPVGTVKSRLHNALTKLQEAWSTAAALKE
jgi:RNA polymerase sigma-70 factor (ECF subfamily)